MNLWKIPNNPATNAKFQFGICLLALCLLALPAFDSSQLVQPNYHSVSFQKPPDTKPKQLLLQASKNLAAAGPIKASAQLEVTLFDEQLVANGQYCQAGQGTRSARLEFVFGNDTEPQSIVQICDRGFFYRITSGKGTPRVQTMDLRRLAFNDKQLLFANQSTWMATGGLSSLLKNLANNFDFYEVRTEIYQDLPVLVVKGRWQEEYLKRLMYGQIRYDTIKDDILWNQVRENIPQECEVVLGNDVYLPLFPYKISFFRSRDVDGESHMAEVVALQLFELQKDADVPEEVFNVNFSGMQESSLTDAFVDRIQNLNEIQRSARRIQNRTNK